jgi:beta-glucosidase
MGGPAIVDVLTGAYNPSGKLPITLPRVTGQIPIYYAHRNTGRPATPESFTHIDDIPHHADQLSVGNTSFHLDTWYKPLFSFGHGMSYTHYRYANLRLSTDRVPFGANVLVSVEVDNIGSRGGTEIVQLYVRDPVASRTRPVRELKGFRRVHLEPGERHTVTFELTPRDLAFAGRDMKQTTEPGRFDVWVGRDADASLHATFVVMEPA